MASPKKKSVDLSVVDMFYPLKVSGSGYNAWHFLRFARLHKREERGVFVISMRLA